MTPEVYSSVIEKAKDKIARNKIYMAKMREEVSSFAVNRVNTSTAEFSQLQEIYKTLARTGNTEKFYAEFYSTVVYRSNNYFGNLSEVTATLLSTKVADFLLVHSKESEDGAAKGTKEKQKVSNIELSGLQYIGGYVLHNLSRKLTQAKVKSPENEQAMSVLKAGKAEDNLLENHKHINSLNRGGLWAITKDAQLIFEQSEY